MPRFSEAFVLRYLKTVRRSITLDGWHIEAEPVSGKPCVRVVAMYGIGFDALVLAARFGPFTNEPPYPAGNEATRTYMRELAREVDRFVLHLQRAGRQEEIRLRWSQYTHQKRKPCSPTSFCTRS